MHVYYFEHTGKQLIQVHFIGKWFDPKNNISEVR